MACIYALTNPNMVPDSIYMRMNPKNIRWAFMSLTRYFKPNLKLNNTVINEHIVIIFTLFKTLEIWFSALKFSAAYIG